MKKNAIEIKKMTVKCDEPGCGWTEEIFSPMAALEYHNKPCPKCNNGIIINDEEAVGLVAFIDLMSTLNGIFPDIKETDHTFEMKVDSSKLFPRS